MVILTGKIVSQRKQRINLNLKFKFKFKIPSFDLTLFSDASFEGWGGTNQVIEI